MIGLDSYTNLLGSRGSYLGDVRKKNSDVIMNAAFKNDVAYKEVYILDKEDGWKYEDAKYSKHATLSILRNSVDYYLQFRPDVHYPVGTYVFIPDDTSTDIGFETYAPEDPFDDRGFDVSKLWLIVGRNNYKQFVLYNIIQCNWNLKWICKYKGERKIMNCWAAVRSMNSYTS